MGYSTTSAVGDGSTIQYAVNFVLGFISRDDVTVYVDGVSVPFTWIHDGLVELHTPPLENALVLITRQASKDTLAHDYEDGALVVEKNLDEANLQHLHNTQELFDRALVAPLGTVFNTALPPAVPGAALRYSNDGLSFVTDNTLSSDILAALAEYQDEFIVVADNIDSVITDAVNIDDINTTASRISDVVIVSNDLSGQTYSYDLGSINELADGPVNPDGDITTVARNITNIVAAVDNLNTINTLADNIEPVILLADSADTLNLISANIDDILGAEAFATSASDSASDALGYRNETEGYRDQTLTAYTAFTSQYLGEKATDPTLNNEGGALVKGALYFNTTNSQMKVYDGSTWVTAYVPEGEYQELLVSGTNIKTINSESLLGSGDIILTQVVDGGTF